MNYVEMAEKVIDKLIVKSKDPNGRVNIFTTSQKRNLLAMTAEIYNEGMLLEDDKLSEEMSERIDYLRVRYMYAAGKEQKVKELLEEAQILDLLKKSRDSKRKFIIFYHYMESLVAFRKFKVEFDKEN